MAADRARDEEILIATRLFTDDQIEAAIRQVDESLEKPERGEYIVNVAESAGQILGYVTYGPAAGLELVDSLRSDPALAGYHLLPSVHGDLLAKLGRFEEARAEFARAAAMTQNARERALLQRKAEAL